MIKAKNSSESLKRREASEEKRGGSGRSVR